VLQRGPAEVQLVPSASQVAEEHAPDTQSLLQQVALDEQLAPSAAQEGCPQVPPWH
jgi:hypothetical protein